MKSIIFSLFSIIIFSGIVVSQTANSVSTFECQKFRMNVFTSPEDSLFRLRKNESNQKFEFKSEPANACIIWPKPQRDPNICYGWEPPTSHPFILQSRKKRNPKLSLLQSSFSIVYTGTEYQSIDLSLELKF